MTEKHNSRQVLGPKALEMVMRDVLGGMEDLALMKCYETAGNIFEVISIDTPESHRKNNELANTLKVNSEHRTPASAQVITLEQYRITEKE